HATASSPAHCHAPAPSGRSATETGSSAFVEEPTRMSGMRSGSRSPTRALPAVGQPLVVDAERRPRSRPQAFLGDRLAAVLADAVRPLVEPGERAVDLPERLLRALAEALVQLAVEGDRGHVAEVVVGAPASDVPELVLHVPRVLGVQVLDRVQHPAALVLD